MCVPFLNDCYIYNKNKYSMSKLENTIKNLDMVKEMISQNRPIFEISRKLGIKYDTLKAHLKKLGIEYKTNPNRKGIAHKEKRKDSYYYLGTEHYIRAGFLKEKLIEDGIKECKCEKCGLTEWQSKPIPLELHHVNGNHYDNRLENLLILCSNCHSLEHKYFSTFHEKQKRKERKKTPYKKIGYEERKRTKKVCMFCGKEFIGTTGQKYCSYDCYYKSIVKSDNEITKELILKLFKEKGSFLQVGKELGISDNAVRKWCKKFDLPIHVEELKQYIADVVELEDTRR